MVLEKLKTGLQDAIKTLRKATVLDKRVIKEYVREIQKTLLSADVNVELVLKLSKGIEERGLLEKPPGSLSRTENVVRITYEEFVRLLGVQSRLDVTDSDRVLLVGVQGSGKTTTIAKLAYYFKKQGLHPRVICADTFRPAAFDQLRQLSAELDVPFYGNPGEKSAVRIINAGLAEFKKQGIVLVDSEGRHKLDEQLMRDLKEIYGILKPDKTLLVLDATIGQTAGEHAKAFREVVDIDGLVLTKLEGSAKGGGALSACAVLNVPVFFIGVGEKIEDLELFDAGRFASKLLGMGDLEGLLEKAKEVELDEESAKRMLSGNFSLNDVYQQIEQMRSMGPLDKIMEMLPMPVKIPKDMLQLQEGKVKKFKVLMDSMTDEEKENPDVIKSTRIERIAKGSGCKPEDVKELLKYYQQMRKFMKGMKPRQMRGLMRKFGSMGL
ncbi:MAG: signal recognition particle receptor subunit alpha [Candidatus Altiarchaeota archaeon]|nr:signal recognition particle receptor subunit alpha [Candidatus Altiarchaeota archaeon]